MPRRTTQYFEMMRERKDRSIIQDEWIEFVIDNPDRTEVQEDGRIRKWAIIDAAGDRYLRVILLEDGETLHNAFFDRGYRP